MSAQKSLQLGLIVGGLEDPGIQLHKDEECEEDGGEEGAHSSQDSPEVGIATVIQAHSRAQ